MVIDNLTIALVVGFAGGLVWFIKGFKVYRQYRVLVDTPVMHIRSIPMGLVEIHGKATPATEKLVNGPVSGAPCLFYKVDIDRWVRSKNGGRWVRYKTDAGGPPFYLDDGTGKVLVDGHGAEYDLLQTCRRDTGSVVGRGILRLFGKRDASTLTPGMGISDQALRNYVNSLGSGAGPSVGSVLGGFLESGSINLGGGSSDRYRLTEFLVLPDHWYDVTGTCVENPRPRDEHDRNMLVKGENEPTFVISWRSEKGIEGALRRRAALHIFGGPALAIACLAALLARMGWLF